MGNLIFIESSEDLKLKDLTEENDILKNQIEIMEMMLQVDDTLISKQEKEILENRLTIEALEKQVSENREIIRESNNINRISNKLVREDNNECMVFSFLNK